MTKRHTIQYELVRNALTQLQGHPTADEIYRSVSCTHPSISRGTVYRNLQRLCEAGEIRKRRIFGTADRYDPLCTDHYHVQCVCCGRVDDVKLEVQTGLEALVTETCGYTILGHEILFRGLCPDCRRLGKSDFHEDAKAQRLL